MAHKDFRSGLEKCDDSCCRAKLDKVSQAADNLESCGAVQTSGNLVLQNPGKYVEDDCSLFTQASIPLVSYFAFLKAILKARRI